VTGTAGSERGRPVYLGAGEDAVFATLHAPDGSPRPVGALLVPPFGWDELCTHRSMRAWAAAFAAAGHPAVRIDLIATGDSGGDPGDGRLLSRWTDAAADAAAWLRHAHGCSRVVGLGIGLGGLIVTASLAAGAPIDDLVLWGVHARGRSLLRELRAFATVATAEITVGAGVDIPPPRDASLEVAGYVLSAETVRSLEAVDLSELAIPSPSGRRVLLLGRDGIPADRRLQTLFEASGAELATDPGDGFGEMVTHPQFARRPQETIARTVAWVGAAPDARPATSDARPVPGAHAHIELAGGEGAIIERPFDVTHGDERLAGVLTTPAERAHGTAPLAVVLLNAGAIRRIGPNRMWVEAARRWAARGISTLRLDMAGLGDSDGEESGYVNNSEFYRPVLAEQVCDALDALEAAGVAGEFLVGGLCSGAYWSYHAALRDQRVRGLTLINLWAFKWTEEVREARDRERARMMMKDRALADIARIAVGRGRVGRIEGLRAAVRALRGSGADERDRDARAAIEELRARAIETLFLFSLDEPLPAELEQFGTLELLGSLPNVTVERIPVADHVFRPVWAQDFVHRQLDAALERALAAGPAVRR
jgi:pimeloyl-ACP methyl ester carboxylesterase